MRVLVNMKKLGKRKNSIEKVPYELIGKPSTVRELIEKMVDVCVGDYNKRKESKELLTNLSLQDIKAQEESGKISFGVNYGERSADGEKAVENALQCFEDGIYRIFCNGVQLEKLNDEIELDEDSELTFVRLTMLAGRMW